MNCCNRALGVSARRLLKRVVWAVIGLAISYALFLLAGFVPTNSNYSLPTADDAVRIFVRSNEIHTDLMLPVRDEASVIDWHAVFSPRDFQNDVSAATWVSIGWGNRQFYVETPTWAEFRLGTAIGALFWPSESVLHVEYLGESSPGPEMREVLITREQYRRLAAFVESSIGERNKQGAAKTATSVSYGSSDRFFVSSGRYHAFNTCNQWTGRGLSRAGVPVGIWTPLKAHVLCWLPDCGPSR